MKMILNSWKVKDLSITEKNGSPTSSWQGNFGLKTTSLFADGTDMFAVQFELDMHDPMYNLSIKILYEFKLLDGVVDEAFKASSFPKVNAPAIAFPYLRALVSTITLQAGLGPVMLPSINFNKLVEEKEDSANNP